MGFSTDAIHAGQSPDLTTGAVMTPIYMTSTYAQEELGKHKGYEYGRTHNLTRAALEKNVATLEKCDYGIAFSSGLSAIHSLMMLLKSGDHVIVTDNVYGGTYRLFELIMKDFGLEFSWVDTSELQNIEKALQPNTKMVFVETPTNPMLTISDIKLIANFCKEKKLISVVDNTFMSPYFQRPIELGSDISVHSSTKYLNGHSDVIGGIVLTDKEKIYERLKYIQNAVGAVPSPFDSWLTLRATKTLAVRMERHSKNAEQIAKYLSTHKKIKKVFYPGLEDHPQHEIAKRQMSGFGGMISIDLGDIEKAKSFVTKVKIFTLAESLGGVESLICHPVSMTHGSVPKEKREKFGLTDSLVRLSVGIEDVDDLLSDIENAMS
ncbi:MAG: cystathionine gamma-synthase [Chlorobiaceae bacterium]|nr:cystathionine gamma-synthase [Chlorobiaceae bacterium]MBA4310388.1 cystathionine gamma-synthase [Chlorobiaceae bacterium]